MTTKKLTHEERERLIAGRLRVAREDAEYTQDEVGSMMGWARQTVSQLETGKRRVLVTDLIYLARLYRLPVTHFTEGL